ncbi:hypothetical protein ABES36_28405 [Bacillus pseudomycoides]|uniref:hypothetical protein n=1 Tax=Bacillus pseudomycoides TaxID=64104 RepID=UPI000BED1DFB|nr:hypothetical protein [Bacillus pseudomycoides]PDZ08130.1 hypothetical protein CON70_29525 [Bacillus pseudomycoides]PDZ71078.1 hypothetical protein CON58_25325 [Bacillus pseudomycoides]
MTNLVRKSSILLFIFVGLSILFIALIIYIPSMYREKFDLTSDYHIIKPSEYDDVYSREDHTDIAIFKRRVEKNPQLKGYNTYPGSEGRGKTFALAIGNEHKNSNIKIEKVLEKGDTTQIIIKISKNSNDIENPMIAFQVYKVLKNIEIQDNEGNIYPKINVQ